MPVLTALRPPVYRHFVLLVWEERDSDGNRLAWRFSLQDSQQEARVGFGNLEELKTYLEQWLEAPRPAGETGQHG
jgi:hypothetical protein